MGPLKKLTMAQLGIIVGIVVALSWIIFPGTAAIVVSVIAGGVMALKATTLDADEQTDTLSD